MRSVVDFDVATKGQTEPINIYVRNSLTEDLVDVAGTSTFALIDSTDETTKDSGSFTAAGSAKITRVSEGIYQYSFDGDTYQSEYILTFRLTLDNEQTRQTIFLKPVSARYLAYSAQLSLQVDKSRKSVSDEIVNMDRSTNEPSIGFFFGYETKHYVYYLDRGMQLINAIPPYTGLTVDDFPFTQYGTILIDAATIAALESQGIFAIDTDYSYSLGGNSLVIDHFTKLSSMIASILGRWQKTVISWKQQYRSKGLVMYQFMPGGVRAMRQLNAQPAGFWSRLLSAVYQ